MSKKISLMIDGQVCEAEEGQNLIEVAKANGVYIPTLCYFSNISKPLGTCRICTIKDRGCFVAACTLTATEGMNLEVNTAELEDLRKGLVEMLFVEGNHMCPACEKSGDCELQALAYRFQMMAPRFPYEFSERDVDFSSSKIVLERNRCVLCKRCIQEIASEEGKPVFAFENRGAKTRIVMETSEVNQLNETQIAQAVHICPVGAILKKGQGFDRPYGTREYDRNPIGYGTHK